MNAEKAKEHFDNIVNKDPIKLNNYGSEQNQKNQRNIYILLVVIPLLLIVSFVFYMIANVDGKMFGTPDDELDNMINSKMKDFMQTIDPSGSESEGGRAGDSFQKIQFAMKMVPAMDNYHHILQRMSMVGGAESQYTGLEENVEYDMDALGDQTDFPSFWEWNGAERHTFSKLVFDSDTVPVGSSAKMCLGLLWTTFKKRNQYDRYMDVRGFDECAQLTSGRAAWEKDYPTRGLNFMVWDQHQQKGDTVCSGGIYIAMSNSCYKYQVMRQVCLLVKFEKDYEHNTYSWVYTGGCFKNSEPVLYSWAEPDVTYDFHDIQFEVRLDHRTSDQIEEEDDDDNEFRFDEEEEKDPDEEYNPYTQGGTKKEKPSQKIQKEKATLKEQRESGELRPQGFYLFYHIFIFIGGLSLLIAIIATGILFYLGYQLIKGGSNDEQNPLVANRAGSGRNQYQGQQNYGSGSGPANGGGGARGGGGPGSSQGFASGNRSGGRRSNQDNMQLQ